MTDDFTLDPTRTYKPKQPVVAAQSAKTESPLDLAASKIPLKKRTANEMREAASERLDLALTAVEAILRDPTARHSDKMAAAVFIRDTSHGKPTERVEHSIDLMTLILGANKREQLQLTSDSLLSAPVGNSQVIDN